MRGPRDDRTVVAGGATGAGATSAAFPVSDGAEWVDGQTWSVDGGGPPHD